jgi:hypothetical protein
MGRETFTHYSFDTATASRGISFERDKDGSRRATTRVTHEAEQRSRNTGKLDPAVDPAVMVIRRSLPRFEEKPNGRFELTIGCPMDVESTCDTTGSMGDNVQTMINVLPETYGVISEVLPGYDPQLALGIFGDKTDRFIINRPQFEMTAEKIVDYVTKLVPESDGGDLAEDPQYAIFGAAYLTDTFTNKIGLKGYYFMCTDAPMHARISPDILERIFGKGVWDALHENGYEFTRQDYPDVREVVRELSAKRHAFVLSIGVDSEYDNYFGSRVIPLRSTDYLPEFESAIIGITEGILEPDEVEKYLAEKGVPTKDIKFALNELLSLPFGAQRELEQKNNVYIPKLGDIFEKKTDIKPIAKSGDSALSDESRSEDTAWL